jgi:predicted RNA-binding Zn-ribbon protein involved in translation (DUF1610 family)
VLADLGIASHCPKCGNEMVRDANSLSLAYSRKGAMMECGRCGEITQWRFTLNPFVLERVEWITWGGTV